MWVPVCVCVTCVTKGNMSGTMPSSIVRAIASRHVAPAMEMLQLSSPSRSSYNVYTEEYEYKHEYKYEYE